MNVRDLIITELDAITAFDVVTGDYLFTLDELQDASLAQGEEKTDITGKQGRNSSTLLRRGLRIMTALDTSCRFACPSRIRVSL